MGVLDAQTGGHPVKCPQCGVVRPWDWFAPASWAGSPEVRHTLCSVCQESERLVWAKRLELYFDRLYRPVAA